MDDPGVERGDKLLNRASDCSYSITEYSSSIISTHFIGTRKLQDRAMGRACSRLRRYKNAIYVYFYTFLVSKAKTPFKMQTIDIIKMYLNETRRNVKWIIWLRTGLWGCCEHGNEPSSSIKGW
jgi:hypothetical protein